MARWPTQKIRAIDHQKNNKSIINSHYNFRTILERGFQGTHKNNNNNLKKIKNNSLMSVKEKFFWNWALQEFGYKYLVISCLSHVFYLLKNKNFNSLQTCVLKLELCSWPRSNCQTPTCSISVSNLIRRCVYSELCAGATNSLLSGCSLNLYEYSAWQPLACLPVCQSVLSCCLAAWCIVIAVPSFWKCKKAANTFISPGTNKFKLYTGHNGENSGDQYKSCVPLSWSDIRRQTDEPIRQKHNGTVGWTCIQTAVRSEWHRTDESDRSTLNSAPISGCHECNLNVRQGMRVSHIAHTKNVI